MNFEDESEFFGFFPHIFFQELYSALEDTIRHTIDGLSIPDSYKKHLVSYILSELQKNFIIFENFCLIHIFSFPVGFLYERKLTDMLVNDDINALLDDLSKLKDELEFYEHEIHGHEYGIRDIKAETDMIMGFVNNEDINELLSNVEFIKKLSSEMKQVMGEKSYAISGILDTKFDKLVANKEVKTEIRKKETNELYSIGSINDIKQFKDNLLMHLK